MSYRHRESIDLLEIYHARQLYALIAAQLRRLAQDDTASPTPQSERRAEILEHYAALLVGADELLRSLGDVPEPHLPG
jgi:hypothetical protein